MVPALGSTAQLPPIAPRGWFLEQILSLPSCGASPTRAGTAEGRAQSKGQRSPVQRAPFMLNQQPSLLL